MKTVLGTQLRSLQNKRKARLIFYALFNSSLETNFVFAQLIFIQKAAPTIRVWRHRFFRHMTQSHSGYPQRNVKISSEEWQLIVT